MKTHEELVQGITLLTQKKAEQIDDDLERMLALILLSIPHLLIYYHLKAGRSVPDFYVYNELSQTDQFIEVTHSNRRKTEQDKRRHRQQENVEKLGRGIRFVCGEDINFIQNLHDSLPDIKYHVVFKKR